MKKLLVATVTAVLLAVSAVTFAQDLPPVPTVPDNAYAAFIDTYQFAVAKGATAEWRKLEWLAVDTKNSSLYVTSSNLAKAMTDGEGDMQFEETACAAIFSGSYDADMNVSRLELVLPGGALDEANEENACDTEAIAGPDNLFVDPMGGLWIGEDTDGHLTIDAEGVFTVASGTMLDFIPVNGTTSNCGASVTERTREAPAFRHGEG